jgi:hypothetical protein
MSHVGHHRQPDEAILVGGTELGEPVVVGLDADELEFGVLVGQQAEARRRIQDIGNRVVGPHVAKPFDGIVTTARADPRGGVLGEDFVDFARGHTGVTRQREIDTARQIGPGEVPVMVLRILHRPRRAVVILGRQPFEPELPRARPRVNRMRSASISPFNARCLSEITFLGGGMVSPSA